MALGAERGNVLRLVMQEVLIMAAAGLASSLATGELIESQLGDVLFARAADPAVTAGGDGRGAAGLGTGGAHPGAAGCADRSDAGAALGIT
jgi:hypothetical protein